MQKTLVALLLLSLSLLAACGTLPAGSGHIITDERALPAFSKVTIGSGLQGTVTVGPPRHVDVTGDDNLLPYIYTTVTGDELSVELPAGGSLEDRRALHVDVVLPMLSSLAAEGAANVDATGLEGAQLDLTATGAGILTASGSAQRLVLNASGASKVLVTPVTAVDVVAIGTGASDVELCSSGMLELHLSGASHAKYGCHPQSVTQDISDASSAEPQ